MSEGPSETLKGSECHTSQEVEKPDEGMPESVGVKPGRARSLANLRPAWTTMTAPRSGGRHPDGGGTKDHPIRARLRAQLMKRRNLRRLVDSWIDAACEGDSAAREQILKRLDPVLEDSASGKQALEAIRLELGPGQASVTLLRGLQGQLPASSSSGDVAGDEASPAG